MALCPCSACGKLNRISLSDAAQKAPICGSCRTPLPFHFGIAETNGTGLKKLVEKSEIPVVCDFWAPWCGPCRSFAPTFQQGASKLGGRVAFAKLNTQEHSMAGDAYGVKSIPTLILFNKDREIDRLSGALPLPDFLEWINSRI